MLQIFSFVINRKLLLFLLAVIININICFCQKDLFFESIPSWVTPTSYSNIVEDTISTGGGYYYLLIERQYNTERKEIFRRYATKILSEKGLQIGSSISESFDPTFNSLIFHSIIIKRNGLIINKLDPKKFELIRREKNLERHVYDGSLTAILNVENVLPGDIIEYAYTIRGQNPLFNGKFFNSFYLNYDVPVGKIYYSILTESSRSLQFKYFNTTKTIDQKTNGSLIIYSWIEENVKALTSDDGAPNWYNPNTRFEVSEFKSNVELNDWAKSLFYISELSRKPIQEKINEIKSKYKQPEEQIGKTIQFVQDEIRYLSISNGISGYKPHPPDQVFNQRFGDCKDKSLLLVTMLKLLKVESAPVLVNSEYGKYLNQSLPSPKNFDHCIIQMNYKDSLYWIDPTITYQRGKMEELHLPSYFNGLVIGSGSSELTPIPFGYHKSNITINENYVLNEVGTSATLDVLTTYSGDEAITMRSYRQANSQDEINKGYLNFYATDHPTIISVSDVTFNDDEEKNLITTHEKYKIESYWLYDSTTSQYKADVYPRLITTYFKIPTTKIRKSPYSLSYPLTIDHFIKVNLPESWKIEDR